VGSKNANLVLGVEGVDFIRPLGKARQEEKTDSCIFFIVSKFPILISSQALTIKRGQMGLE
jgi:hypothetical protein